jgi:hypothetical protein
MSTTPIQPADATAIRPFQVNIRARRCTTSATASPESPGSRTAAGLCMVWNLDPPGGEM